MAFRTLPLDAIMKQRDRAMRSECGMKLIPPGGDEIVARLLELKREEQQLLEQWRELQLKCANKVEKAPPSRVHDVRERKRKLEELLD